MTQDYLHACARDATPYTLTCQVDHIARNSHGVFGFGWALDRDAAITRGVLRLRFGTGEVRDVKVSMGRGREDVAQAFPDHPQAACAGLMFMAGWSNEPPESVELVFDMEDGRSLGVPIALPVEEEVESPPVSPVPARVFLARRALSYLRKGEVRRIIRWVSHHRRFPSAPMSPETIALASRLKGRRCRLVIDHSMGGGANVFRDRLVSGWLAQGDSIVLLSFRVALMSAYVQVRTGADVFELDIGTLETLAAAVASAKLVEIFFNCAVSFPRPEEIQKLLLDIQRRSRAPLVVAMHEYFVVCPSPFLLDKDGKYCGVPAIEHCESCLRHHDDGFVSLTGERSIERWRSMWGEFLHAADEVRCFSPSTKRLLERAYPGMVARTTLVPHKVDPLRPVRHVRLRRASLTIGVIGFISHHKGANVVTDLAAAISTADADVRIVVLGSMDSLVPSGVILQTGPYDRPDLPGLVEKHGIDIALLPSICPETFSFVAHEVISMGLPVVCLDLGAQADLVRAAPKGKVSPCQDGPGLLREILAFGRDLQVSNEKVFA